MATSVVPCPVVRGHGAPTETETGTVALAEDDATARPAVVRVATARPVVAFSLRVLDVPFRPVVREVGRGTAPTLRLPPRGPCDVLARVPTRPAALAQVEEGRPAHATVHVAWGGLDVVPRLPEVLVGRQAAYDLLAVPFVLRLGIVATP